ncbi:MAG: hypothetical protein Q9167_005316 [Letrouitia subvulpina]
MEWHDGPPRVLIKKDTFLAEKLDLCNTPYLLPMIKREVKMQEGIRLNPHETHILSGLVYTIDANLDHWYRSIGPDTNFNLWGWGDLKDRVLNQRYWMLAYLIDKPVMIEKILCVLLEFRETELGAALVFERKFSIQLFFVIFDLNYDKPRISSYILLRIEIKSHIQAFADGARKDECTHLRNLFIQDLSEPTVEAKERFRSVLRVLQIEPLEKTSGHQSKIQGRDWPRQLYILSRYLQGGQDADQSDDLVEEDEFSDPESSDDTTEPGEEPTDEEDGFSDSKSTDDTADPGDELTDETEEE